MCYLEDKLGLAETTQIKSSGTSYPPQDPTCGLHWVYCY